MGTFHAMELHGRVLGRIAADHSCRAAARVVAGAAGSRTGNRG
ncbi:hypothetical protein [uncultured Jannaschia sp.]|nr:hypothetical protein [uncultured Jannaschia sp.]